MGLVFEGGHTSSICVALTYHTYFLFAQTNRKHKYAVSISCYTLPCLVRIRYNNYYRIFKTKLYKHNTLGDVAVHVQHLQIKTFHLSVASDMFLACS